MAKSILQQQPRVQLQPTPVAQAMILWVILHVHAKVMNSGQEVSQFVDVSLLFIPFRPLRFIIIILTQLE